MKKLIDKLNRGIVRAQFAAKNFMSEERGDTNFISIAIVLVVVLVLAAIFIAFGKQLTPKLTAAVTDIMNKLP